MTNRYKTLITISIISIILILSGCVSKPKENSIEKIPEKNIIQTPGNNTTQIQDIINVLIPTPSSTYQDDRLIKIVEEANNIIDNNNIQLMTAAEKGNFEDIEKYGQKLELSTAKYMSIMKDLSISPKLKKMYSEYYNYLENMNKAGQHIQESAKQYKLMNNGSCNNPSAYNRQM